jgi:hypothetical protein
LGVNSRVLFVVTQVYWPIMLDPTTMHVAKKPLPQYVCGEGPSKNVVLKCIDSTHCV